MKTKTVHIFILCLINICFTHSQTNTIKNKKQTIVYHGIIPFNQDITVLNNDVDTIIQIANFYEILSDSYPNLTPNIWYDPSRSFNDIYSSSGIDNYAVYLDFSKTHDFFQIAYKGLSYNNRDTLLIGEYDYDEKNNLLYLKITESAKINYVEQNFKKNMIYPDACFSNDRIIHDVPIRRILNVEFYGLKPNIKDNTTGSFQPETILKLYLYNADEWDLSIDKMQKDETALYGIFYIREY